jgi:hypothetical protein
MNNPFALSTAAVTALLAAQVALGQGFGQPVPSPAPAPAPPPVQGATGTSFQNRLATIIREAADPGQKPSPPPLARFDLDFPGGSPDALVRAIEKSSGKPVNAIIPNEFANLTIPPLKMRAVTVPELFEALTLASQSTIAYYVDGGGGYGAHRVMQQATTSYGFRTQGPPGEASVWYFFYNKPNLPEEAKTCRFWQLGPYLDTYKIDDITTAIQTGYRMLGADEPTISFHKDTHLLIAVGEGSKLTLIDDVLRQLQPEASNRSQGTKLDDMSMKSMQPGVSVRTPGTKKPSTAPPSKAESTPTPSPEGSSAP